jgi:tetratricopeptide (TPR) repeat protein
MKCRSQRFAAIILLSHFLATATAFAEPPEPSGDPQFWTNYNQGLMAIREGRVQDAVPLLTSALQHTPDPRGYFARGVAHTLLQNFDNAIADLSHAHLPLEPGQAMVSREPQLWGYCIWAMSNKTFTGGNAPSTSWFSGIPGNVIQGSGDYPTDYASCLAYEMAIPYRRARDAKQDLHSPALQVAFRKAGQWFANRALATRPMAEFNLQYARQRLEGNDLARALDAVNLVQLVYPFDADIRLVTAEAYRRLGRVETARREYTVSLTMVTNSAAAYRGRALAAAAEGDANRALADLRSARKYDPKTPPDLTQTITSTLAHNALPPNTTPATTLARLDSAALAGGTVEQLLPLALDLQKSAASTCVRYDEVYQEQLRQLEDFTREKPTNPDGFVALATYILDELNNRGEAVEPRRNTQFYRYQYSQAMEASRAIFALNQALKINPKHAGALVRLAFAYDAINQPNKAENCINQVMQLVGTQNADAIRLLAEYRAGQAGSLQARAQSLRTPRYISSSHTENRSDGVYKVTVSTRIDPSQDDLQKAGDCDAQARVLVTQAQSLMESAIKNNPASLEGQLLQAAYQNWFGTKEKALQILQQAVMNSPSSLKAHDALLEFELVHGMTDEAIEERMSASKLYQTTAGPLLERIWQRIQVNGWPPLMADLERARQADPADARTTAYLAPAQWDNKQNAASLASKHEAIALELARLQLDDQGQGAKLPRPAADFGLIMQMLGRSAVQEAGANQLDLAVADVRAAAAFGARFAPGGNGELMFRAMLPNAHAPALPVPAPINGATLIAQAYVTAGQYLKKQNKNADAISCFQSAATLGRLHNSGTPQIGNASGDTNYSQFATGRAIVTAWFELAKVQTAVGNYQAAFEALNNAGENKPDRQTALKINDLMLHVVQHLNSQPRPHP